MLYYQVACTLISVFVSSTQNEAYEGRFRWAACIPLLSLKRRDDQSNAALLTSHCACEETGEWPSDHGMEALTINLLTL
jgi:hypothetical protein